MFDPRKMFVSRARVQSARLCSNSEKKRKYLYYVLDSFTNRVL